jgi:hypothetical protein
MNITIAVPTQRLADMMIGALEGGSNYWLVGCRLESPSKTGLSDTPWYASPELYENPALKIVFTYSEDDDDSEHTEKAVTLEEIILGTQAMSAKAPQHFADIMSEHDDATTADVWLQYVLFGEIVYG